MKKLLLVILVALVTVAVMAQIEPEYRIGPFRGKPGWHPPYGRNNWTQNSEPVSHSRNLFRCYWVDA